MARKTGLGRAFQQVRKPHQQLALAHPDGVLDAGKGEEFDLQLGQGRAWAKFPMCFLKDVKRAVTHVRLD